MEDYIIGKIESILGMVVDAGGGDLALNPATFNTSIYNGVITIMENGVKPVAYVLLGLLFMLELYNITIRTEGQHGTMGVEIPFKVMFKIVVCKTAIDSTKLILEGIYAISSGVISNIKDVISGGGSLSPADIEAIREVVGDMDFSVKLMTSVEVTLIWLIVSLITVIISVILVGRMIEIYVMMAIAPIPLATFPNAEMSSVAKNFLKSFAAVCLQGVLIYIVIAIFPLLLQAKPMGDIDSANDFSMTLLTALGYSFVLLVSIFATGKWSKSICNAM